MKSKKKMNLGEGGVQGLFVRHVEKIVLGVAVLMVVYFLYSGATLESFDQSRYTPAKLQADAQRARTNVGLTGWDDLKDDPDRRIEDIQQRLEERGERLPVVSDAAYRTEMAWLPPTFPLRTKRSDPELYPPVKVEAVGAYGPIAMRRTANDTSDPILDIAIEPKKEEKPRPRPSTTRRRGAGMGEMDYGMEMAQYGMESMGGMGAMGGYGGAGSTRRPDKEQLEAMPGYRPSGGGMSIGGAGYEGMADGMGAAGYGASAGGPTWKGQYFVAVKALFPIKKQWEEYERCFAETGFYNAGRDVPKFAYYRVQRAVVADGGAEPAADDWKTLSTPRYFRLTEEWAGMPREITHPDYFDELVTGPAPPVMNRELDALMLHADVPRKPLEKPKPVVEEKAEEPQLADGEVDPRKLRELQRKRGASGRAGYGAEMYGGGMEYGSEMYGGDMYGMGMGGDMYGMGMGMGGDDMYSMGGGMRLAQPPPVDYKLIRFYDFDVRPGVQYRYRVQVWLEDPNHPQSPELSPRVANLDDDVVLRLRDVDQKEKEREKAQLDGGADAASARTAARIYWRETDWSEPSGVATIPQQYEVLAGQIEPEPRIVVRDTAPGYSFVRPGAEIKATMMAIRWDQALGVDVPVKIDGTVRGSVVNLKKNVEVLHPIQLVLKTIDYDLVTNSMVLDLRGGDTIPPHPDSRDGEPLKAPGEMLVIDHQGRLTVTRELEDLETFRRYDWPEEEKKPAASAEMDYGYGMEGTMGEMPQRGRRARGVGP